MALAESSSVDDIDFLVQQKNRIQDQLMREKGDHLGLSKKNFPDKFRNYLIVTVLLLVSGIFAFCIYHYMKARNRQRIAKYVPILAATGFVVASCVFATLPDFLVTRDGRNGCRNLALIYFANIELLFFIAKVNMNFISSYPQNLLCILVCRSDACSTQRSTPSAGSGVFCIGCSLWDDPTHLPPLSRLYSHCLDDSDNITF